MRHLISNLTLVCLLSSFIPGSNGRVAPCKAEHGDSFDAINSGAVCIHPFNVIESRSPLGGWGRPSKTPATPAGPRLGQNDPKQQGPEVAPKGTGNGGLGRPKGTTGGMGCEKRSWTRGWTPWRRCGTNSPALTTPNGKRVDELYNVQVEPHATDTFDLLEDPSYEGGPIPNLMEAPWSMRDIKNKEVDRHGGMPISTIVKTYESPQAQTIIISASYNKNQDHLRLNGKSAEVRWSDMVMYNWKDACRQPRSTSDSTPLAQPHDFKYIIRDNIKEAGPQHKPTVTYTTLEKIHKDLGGGEVPKSGLILTPSGPTKVHYDAFLATPHGDRVKKMLEDYKDDMNKEIKSFTLFKEADWSQWSVIIEIGH